MDKQKKHVSTLIRDESSQSAGIHDKVKPRQKVSEVHQHNSMLVEQANPMQIQKQHSTPSPVQQTTQSSVYTTHLNQNDVLLGRGAPVFRYEGNVKFRKLVFARKLLYRNCLRNQTKNEIAKEIVSNVTSENGRFVREIKTSTEAALYGLERGTKAWVLVNQKTIMQKVKQTLRELDDTLVNDVKPASAHARQEVSRAKSVSLTKAEKSLVFSRSRLACDSMIANSSERNNARISHSDNVNLQQEFDARVSLAENPFLNILPASSLLQEQEGINQTLELQIASSLLNEQNLSPEITLERLRAFARTSMDNLNELPMNNSNISLPLLVTLLQQNLQRNQDLNLQQQVFAQLQQQQSSASYNLSALHNSQSQLINMVSNPSTYQMNSSQNMLSRNTIENLNLQLMLQLQSTSSRDTINTNIKSTLQKIGDLNQLIRLNQQHEQKKR